VELVDHTEKDNTMLILPRWKNLYTTKNKWITKKGFDLTTNKYGTSVIENCPW